jgi:hypothetical protein
MSLYNGTKLQRVIRKHLLHSINISLRVNHKRGLAIVRNVSAVPD